MSIATSRANIKILALPPDVDAQEEEAKKMEKKTAKKNGKKKMCQIKKARIRRPQQWMELSRRILYLRRF